MKLKQRFLSQNIIILISTILITFCFVLGYIRVYNLLNNAQITQGIGQNINIIMEDDLVIYESEDFSTLEIKEIRMNLAFNNNYYKYRNNSYRINTEEFTGENGTTYKIINLNQVMDLGVYYKKLLILVFIVFFISFIGGNLLVQRRNMRELISPITDLTRDVEKLRLGELETAITDRGYDEVRKLATAIEEMRLQLKNSIYYQEKVDDNRKFLISSISHDLKTPVTSIRGYIDGILDGVADTDEKKAYYLAQAIDKTKVINTMIEDLLLYSKLDLNQMPFEKTRVDMVGYLEDCVEDNRADFLHENKKISFENQISIKPYLLIDGEQFKRVLQNIMDNARKNIKSETGSLRLILREINSSLIIEFQDNGRGIDQEDLPHIFDRFYRGDRARKTGGSSGLGLAIAKQIVEGHGGRIWAISEGNQGTSIMISLKKLDEDVVK